MKILRTMGMLSALALGALSPAAFASDYIRANVPFAFVVGGQHFAAGEYLFKEDEAGVILVQGGGKGVMVLSTPASSAGAASGTSLRFTNADQQLHLTLIEQGAETRSIPLHSVLQRSVTMSSH